MLLFKSVVDFCKLDNGRVGDCGAEIQAWQQWMLRIKMTTLPVSNRDERDLDLLMLKMKKFSFIVI
jgi:hypothetical protein